MILWAAVVLGLALVVLDIRELRFLARKQREAIDVYGHASWLVDIIWHSSLSTTIAAGVLLALTVDRQLVGPQPWTVYVSAPVILWLLLIPVLRGTEWRRHE